MPRLSLKITALILGLALLFTAIALAVARRNPPDGAWIMFISSRDSVTGDDEIYRMWSDGSQVHRVTGDPLGWKMQLNAASDGEWLYFVSNHEGNDEIYRMKFNGGSRQRITYYPGFDWYPHISPDGKTLLFFSDRDHQPGLYRLSITDNPDDSHARPITPPLNQTIRNPSWSPDGEWIVYQTSTVDATEIYRMRLDGTGLQELAHNRGAVDLSPAWSPDGQWIVFSRQLAVGNMPLMLIHADGTDRHTITDALPDSTLFDPSWSPDGETIAFWRRENGTSNIYTIRRDGTQLRQISASGVDVAPVWMPYHDLPYHPAWLLIPALAVLAWSGISMTPRNIEYRASIS